jgi:hypothetical protein
VAITDRVTVNYQCMWESFYHGIGETPPPGAVPNINPHLMFDWWRALNAREREIVSRLTGVTMEEVAAAVATSTARRVMG